MAATGVEILVDADTLSVVGITEVLSRIRQIAGALALAKKHLKAARPRLLILIDYPDFNLRLAACARELGIRVLYYISPQIWAWRSGRVRLIKRIVDHMAVILPFETRFYQRHRVPVTFVGHPLMEDRAPVAPETWDARLVGPPCIGFLPGSRASEVKKLLPAMMLAAERISRDLPQVRILLSRSRTLPFAMFQTLTSPFSGRVDFEIVDGVREIHDRAWFAVTASGTATLETALAGVPMVVVYKVSPISYVVGRALIRVGHIALVNLIAGKRLVPELIQHQASADRIARTVLSRVTDMAGLKRSSRALMNLRSRLGDKHASDNTADIAFRIMGMS